MHGNWTEARPFRPSTQEPQRLYATLAEGRQRIIGGVLARPETLQAEPAKSSPASLARPLQQVNPAFMGLLDVIRQSGCNHRSLAAEHSCWSILLDQNDEWAVLRARYITLESISSVGDHPIVGPPMAAG